MIVHVHVPNYVDERGDITDLLKYRKIESVTLITTRVGSVRGNHYHTTATVYVFIVKGRFQVSSRFEGRVEHRVVDEGDLVEFPPYDLHALCALEEGSFLLMADGPRGGEMTVREEFLH